MMVDARSGIIFTMKIRIQMENLLACLIVNVMVVVSALMDVAPDGLELLMIFKNPLMLVWLQPT